MKCVDCKYSRLVPDPQKNLRRVCYFTVPQVVPVPTPQGLAPMVLRPNVEDDDFCSEFKEKTNNVPTKQTASVIVD